MKLLVLDIMTQDPILVDTRATLLDCVKKMVKERVGSVLIVDKKRLVGLISNKDIMWAIIKKSKSDLTNINAVDISPRKIATTKPNATVDEAWSKMKKLKFERLPVIHEGELVGLITMKDILNFNPEHYQELRDFEKIKEEASKLKRIKRRDLYGPRTSGICEECGNEGSLQRVNGMLICDSCSDLV